MYKRKLDWKKLDENERRGIIRKVFDCFRDLARSVADRLQQMLRLGRVDVKKAIREMRPDSKAVTKVAEITEMTSIRQHHLRLG